MSQSALLATHALHLAVRGSARQPLGITIPDFALRPGQTLGIEGRSGTGKSTLLLTLCGLQPPYTGEVEWSGQNLSRMSESDRLSLRQTQIGFVFQSHHLIPGLTVEENLDLPVRLAGRKPDPIRRSRLTESLGLAGLLKRKPFALSQGQRQRVALVRAVIHRPALVLADEPTAALDPQSASELMQLLLDLTRHDGLALILASHDPAVLTKLEARLSLSLDRAAFAGGDGS
ncbi:MAG: ABC transporter ATP-binding protein [Asticcacaulis sp.]